MPGQAQNGRSRPSVAAVWCLSAASSSQCWQCCASFLYATRRTSRRWKQAHNLPHQVTGRLLNLKIRLTLRPKQLREVHMQVNKFLLGDWNSWRILVSGKCWLLVQVSPALSRCRGVPLLELVSYELYIGVWNLYTILKDRWDCWGCRRPLFWCQKMWRYVCTCCNCSNSSSSRRGDIQSVAFCESSCSRVQQHKFYYLG